MLTIQIHCTPIYTTEIHTVGAHVCRAITCSSLFYTVSPPYPQLTQALSVMDDFANRNKMSTFRKWDVAVLDWREGLRTTTTPHYIIIQQYHWSPETTVTDIAWPNSRGTDVNDARWMYTEEGLGGGG